MTKELPAHGTRGNGERVTLQLCRVKTELWAEEMLLDRRLKVRVTL